MYKHLHASSSDDEALDAPPPYEIHSSGNLLASSAAVNGHGSVDISFSSASPKELQKLLPLPPTQPQSGTELPAIPRLCPNLNVVIQVVGSRGDVQPFIAFGVALQRRGHRVRLATHDTFSKFVRTSGLEFYPIGGNPEDLMAYMVKNPGLIPSMEALRNGEIGRKRRMVKEMLHGCWLSCIDADPESGKAFVADAIVANPPSFAHVHCAQALGIPLHIMFTMPWSATRDFPHPLANIMGNNLEPAQSNWLSYGVVDLMTWQGLGGVVNSWRKKELKLEELPTSVGATIVNHLRIPHTYCWSPTLVAKPTDWKPEIDVCGFFMRDEPQYAPPPDLEAFLAAGPPPLYVGFGSIVLDNPERLTQIILDATRSCGVRTIISRGWSKLGGNSPNNDQVFYLGDCPHEWLFKRVSAVVHHGGAGTTACGLVNARPTIIVPFFGDQPFWANVVANAGAGPRPIPQNDLTVDKLIRAIEFVMSSSAIQSAQTIAEKMRQEGGVDSAVDSFYRWLPINEMQCQVIPSHPARWLLTAGKRRIRLSDVAVAALVEENRIKLDKLKGLRTREHDTDVRRWDPVTGGAASMLGVVTEFTTAFGGTFIDPFKAYKEARNNGGSVSAGSGAAAQGAIKNVGGMAGAVTKGALVSMPLAFAEGLRQVPRLYGEEVYDHGKVTDWQSGGVVAAKNFGYGFYDGITGFVTQPYKGAKKEGALGFLKGAAKGSIELATKPGAAMFGLMAYPAQGIYKSFKRTRFLDSVLRSKCALVDEYATSGGDKADTRQIAAVFDNLFQEG